MVTIGLTMKNATVVIVGAGSVGASIASVLCSQVDETTTVRVIANHVTGAGLDELEFKQKIAVRRKDFVMSDLTGRESLVFAVTNDKELNMKIAFFCDKRGIPVYVHKHSGASSMVLLHSLIDPKSNVIIGVGATNLNDSIASAYKEKLFGTLKRANFEIERIG